MSITFIHSGVFYQETSNEEENNEENEDSNGNEDEESDAENTTLSTVTPGYGEDIILGTGTMGLAGIQLPKKVVFAPKGFIFFHFFN